MSRHILYQRDDCHLCDQALDLLARVRFPEPRSVFIDDDQLAAMAGELEKSGYGDYLMRLLDD